LSDHTSGAVPAQDIIKTYTEQSELNASLCFVCIYNIHPHPYAIAHICGDLRGMYLRAAPLTTFHSPSSAVEQTSRYVDECCICILNIDISILVLTHSHVYKFDTNSILEMPIYKTLSFKMVVRVRFAHAESPRARFLVVL
jgi:hypothetical protein